MSRPDDAAEAEDTVSIAGDNGASGAYLFTWKKELDPKLPEQYQQFLAGTLEPFAWSSGSRKDIPSGARIFFMRQGVGGPRGIFAIGHTITGHGLHPHEHGREGLMNANIVEVDELVDPDKPLLSFLLLRSITNNDDTLWNSQGSGRTIPPDIRQRLEFEWNRASTREQRQQSITSSLERPQESNAGTDWSDAECIATVADYFDMLAADLLRQDYSKAAHNRALQRTVNRSSGSIEFKHANISAVLVEMQQPYIEGYKPRGNFQRRLAETVADYLDEHPDFFLRPEILSAIEPTTPSLINPENLLGIFEDPPEIILPLPASTPWLSRRGHRVNFTERDARNRQLGRLGEQFALDVERRILIDAGRTDLAGRVEWIAETCGDGVGFDVLSYNAATEAEKWIEVKTTGLGKYHPFLVTANEVRCSEAEPGKFSLFRVFDYRTSPRAFVLTGSLSSKCDLRPSLFTAVSKPP